MGVIIATIMIAHMANSIQKSYPLQPPAPAGGGIHAIEGPPRIMSRIIHSIYSIQPHPLAVTAVTAPIRVQRSAVGRGPNSEVEAVAGMSEAPADILTGGICWKMGI